MHIKPISKSYLFFDRRLLDQNYLNQVKNTQLLNHYYFIKVYSQYKQKLILVNQQIAKEFKKVEKAKRKNRIIFFFKNNSYRFKIEIATLLIIRAKLALNYNYKFQQKIYRLSNQKLLKKSLLVFFIQTVIFISKKS